MINPSSSEPKKRKQSTIVKEASGESSANYLAAMVEKSPLLRQMRSALGISFTEGGQHLVWSMVYFCFVSSSASSRRGFCFCFVVRRKARPSF